MGAVSSTPDPSPITSKEISGTSCCSQSIPSVDVQAATPSVPEPTATKRVPSLATSATLPSNGTSDHVKCTRSAATEGVAVAVGVGAGMLGAFGRQVAC